MFLPQIVRSARGMKKSGTYVTPFVGENSSEDLSVGTIIMATVRGDVHDIGKNIVSVVLGCNNYRVVDLGVGISSDKIIKAIREYKADIIGLSGLIMPSLGEMVHVAQELQKQGLKLPLLIGGATTSANHTALKIAQSYEGPVIHVKDALGSVEVCNSLMNSNLKERILKETNAEYVKIREEFASRQSKKQFLKLEKARECGLKTDWSKADITKPSFLGTKVFEDYDLNDLVPRIDWTPFFLAWELKYKYPAILKHPELGEEANKLFDDAQKMLNEIIEKKLLTAKAVIGFYPANSIGDDIEVYTDDNRSEVLTVFHTLREQAQKVNDQPYYALSDLVAPKETGVKDYVGAFSVTAGLGIASVVKAYENDHDDYRSIMMKALADRLAEAFAERMHERVRKEFWGYAPNENLTNREMIQCKYRGIRPAPGYPACPDHTAKSLVFKILDTERNTGINLTENFAMLPAASVSGIYYAHPEAKYFWLGHILKDQVEDFAKRKGMDLAMAEKWLSPNLGYSPEMTVGV